MKKEKKNNGIPLTIIAIVLVLVVVGGFLFYNMSRPAATPNRNTAASNSAKATPPVNAPAGASIGVNMLGSPTAAVTVEEFADFQCGSCAAAHPVMKEIQSAYGNRIKFVFRHFPLAIPAHDKAYEAAVATEAAGLQGKFWAMQDQLMTNQHLWSSNPNYRQLWSEYAQKIGLDVAKFQADLAGDLTKKRVDADLQRGRGLSVSSTPSVFINGRSVPFTELKVASLRQIIDSELQSSANNNQSATSNSPAANSNAK